MKQTIRRILTKSTDALVRVARQTGGRLPNILRTDVYFGRNIAHLPQGAIVFFPIRDNTFCCGIAAIVSYKSKKSILPRFDPAALEDMSAKIAQAGYETCKTTIDIDIADHYLGGQFHIDSLWQAIQNLKCSDRFYALFTNSDDRRQLTDLCDRLTGIASAEAQLLSESMGRIPVQTLELMTARMEKLKDIAWCIRWEIIHNLKK
jgi:glucosamine--fructose-6-phosphate aminotransferase (isomerizing)